MRWWVNILAVLAVVCLVFSVPFGLAVGAAEAAVAVSDADTALRGAFDAVLDAEAAGANVSAVLVSLGWAGGNLTLAEGAFQGGDYAGAVAAADACSALAGAAAGEADGLRVNAVAAAGLWWQTVAFSVVGACVFVVVLALVWRWLRRVYGRRIVASRPEVLA